MTSTWFNWADFYLICFAIGFCFSFLSWVLGSARLGHFHLPHFHGHAGGDFPAAHGPAGHLPAGHGPAGHGAAGHSPASGGHAAHGPGADDSTANHPMHSSVSPFNFVTLTAFLAWFGGTGYLLTRFSTVWVGLGLFFSVISGVVGGGVIFLFLSRVLMSDEENMDPADTEMVGVLGRICVPIREGGIGEIVYSQVGTRRVCGARSEDGTVIAKGTEVVVTRYEKGLAYVRRWEEMANQ